MDKFTSFFNNLKNMNSDKIVDTKKNQENLNPKAVIGIAKKQ